MEKIAVEKRLLKAASKVYGRGRTMTQSVLDQMAEKYGPWKGYWAYYLRTAAMKSCDSGGSCWAISGSTLSEAAPFPEHVSIAPFFPIRGDQIPRLVAIRRSRTISALQLHFLGSCSSCE